MSTWRSPGARWRISKRHLEHVAGSSATSQRIARAAVNDFIDTDDAEYDVELAEVDDEAVHAVSRRVDVALGRMRISSARIWFSVMAGARSSGALGSPDCVAGAARQVVPFGRCNTASRLVHLRELAGFEECSRERDVANHPTPGRATVHTRAASCDV